MPQTKKLIEIDLPLDAINRESAREKSPARAGHPSTLHIWWARRPLAACRAVIFASMVDDPSSLTDEFPSEEAQLAERRRLHDIIERLVKWDTIDETNPASLALVREARYEIARSVARSHREDPPDEDAPKAVLEYLNDRALPIYDPFAGGGSIPLETQRLGLRAVASDLNPVAVLINKALIEIPLKFAGKHPVNPDAPPGMKTGKMVGRGKNRKPEIVPWRGAAGLADDIRYYGRWMRERAYERIGHLYPKAKLPDGDEATVVAWLWARTVPCPNPACGADMPLMRTFRLFSKPNNRYWIKPIINQGDDGTSVSFEVQNHDDGVPSGGTVGRNGAKCVACDASVPLSYVRERARAGEMREKMTAVAAEGVRKRLFFSATDEHVDAARAAEPKWRPSGRIPEDALGISLYNYGFTEWHNLFTKRQLTALTTFSDLIPEVRDLIVERGESSAYANTVCTYLALAIGKNTNSSSSFARWDHSLAAVIRVFASQRIQMMWDFAEVNLFSTSTQNWTSNIEWVAKVVERLPSSVNAGECHQADATTTIHADSGPVIVTDPPYYDNAGYADLSDFFYVWLRPLLRDIYPDLFSGIMTPKDEEMIASPRFENPSERFEGLMGAALRLIRERSSQEFPSSIFYAYKQREQIRDGTTSTGWDTMLSSLVDSGFRIVGTWPMRTEHQGRLRAIDSNALASSVILVCRPRDEDAPIATRREFIDALERDLPPALGHLTREGHIAPVDLAQAAIGPGMEIYSQYSRVETIAGEPVPVREALIQINRVIGVYHRGEQGELDPESNFCMDFLRQFGFAEASFGEVAESLSKSHNVDVEVLDDLNLLVADAGKVRLLPMERYGPDRPYPQSGRMTAWEGCHRMAFHMTEDGGGVTGCARVALRMDGGGEPAERLARILYDYFDSKGDSRRAFNFNSVAASWEAIQTEIRRVRDVESQAPLE